MRNANIDRRALLAAIAVLLAGCGTASDAPKTVPVKGVVKYKGKPIPSLSVAFTSDKGTLALGKTGADGRFELMTSKPGDGATVGPHKVAVSFVTDEIPPMPGMAPPGYKPPVSPIPAKYADVNTSGLTQTVDKDPAKNDLTIELND